MSQHFREEEFLTYLDGRLPSAERARLDGHLAECPACRAQMQEFRALLGVLGEWKPIRPSPGFDAALHARLEGGEPARTGWFVFRPAYGVGVAIVFFVAIGFGLWQVAPPAPAPPAPTIAQTQPASPPSTPPALPPSVQRPQGDDLAVLDNQMLLDNYDLLEEFDVLFEPLNKEQKKL